MAIDTSFITPIQMPKSLESLGAAQVTGTSEPGGLFKSIFENAIKDGLDIILEVDVNGAANVRKKCSDNFSIFILPPSFEILKERLINRGTETMDVIEKRLLQAKEEIRRAPEYDYIVVNDDLQTAVDEVCDIILTERHKTVRCNDILSNFKF